MIHRLRPLLHFFLPRACPVCLETLADQSSRAPFCPTCMNSFRHLTGAGQCSCCALPFKAAEQAPHLCGRCSAEPPPFVRVYAVGLYENALRQAIHLLKFKGKVHLDKPLAILLNAVLPEQYSFDLIVPVPLSRRGLRQRGYNQALLLARQLSGLRRIPLLAAGLVKTRETLSQHDLAAEQRHRNLRDSFALLQPVEGRTVLLVDDVLTTGATASLCAEALLNAGAREVHVAVLGRAD